MVMLCAAQALTPFRVVPVLPALLLGLALPVEAAPAVQVLNANITES